MNRLFLRMFLLVVLATSAASFLTISVLDLQVSPAENSALETQLGPSLTDIAARLDAGEPAATVFAEVGQRVGDTLAVLPLDLVDLEPAQRARVEAGEVVLRGSGLARQGYVRIGQTDQVVELELLGIKTVALQWANLPGEVGAPAGAAVLEQLDPLDRARLAYRPVKIHGGVLVPEADGVQLRPIHRLLDVRMLGMGISALCLALAILVSLWPVRRELLALSEGAERLRSGDLAARVPVRARSPGAVGSVALQFNAMADRVQGLIESHEELLRSVSHEMQTPVARLVFAIDALEADSTRTEVLEGMRQTVEEMRVLADEVLQFNRLGRVEDYLVEREPVDLAELAEDVALSYEGTTVEAEPPAVVPGDPRLLYRALKNLVENALAYATPPVLRVEQDAQHVRVHVDDAGTGIPREDWERVFEPFVRVEGSRARKTGGTGLGLAIVHRIAQRHGGSCAVGTSPEGGARLTLTLPVRA